MMVVGRMTKTGDICSHALISKEKEYKIKRNINMSLALKAQSVVL